MSQISDHPPKLLPAYPTSFLTCLQISPQNFKRVSEKPSCFYTAQFVFFSFVYYCHPVLGLMVMVGWISLIGREGTLAQVCFPELETDRKDVKFDMLQCKQLCFEFYYSVHPIHNPDKKPSGIIKTFPNTIKIFIFPFE
jgi:hypothetical protein